MTDGFPCFYNQFSLIIITGINYTTDCKYFRYQVVAFRVVGVSVLMSSAGILAGVNGISFRKN